ncbi:hypothetical protein [Candidatus Venteria ishoeyi]|uniref:Uncharacterized protein n=1 Tax=Candidatus Venteria ishoeyi TaxID=1899563 RepID=A0A1H6FEY6_9GAMM|nr:hypothetical protein [Candidatus Venteria ishoeyi]MDM8545068.1 hypothetical protein [Candidatus Venteria ishoeyi]SEH07909.1 Uncharacterised protein [Candidatus Venteria ishoeyi]
MPKDSNDYKFINFIKGLSIEMSTVAHVSDELIVPTQKPVYIIDILQDKLQRWQEASFTHPTCDK